MVPEPVIGGGESVDCHRVGPNGSLASDSQFGVSLTSLWHDVAAADQALSFASDVPRPAVAAVAAGLVAQLRAGQGGGVALIAGRELVGYGHLTPGVGAAAHTATVATLMVAPARCGTGLGGRLLSELRTLARELNITRVRLTVRAGAPLAFFERHGLGQVGRLPGWSRRTNGDDDVLLLLADWAGEPERG